MPNNTSIPIIMTFFMFIASFCLVFEWIGWAIAGLAAVVIMMIVRSFDYDDGFYVKVDEIKRIERKARGL
jgi:cytochrome aa3-600 menaquinol oxidase subunit 1